MIKKILLAALCFIVFNNNVLTGIPGKPYHDPAKTGKCWFNLMLNDKKIGYFSFLQLIGTEGGSGFIVREEETYMRVERSHNVVTNRTNSFKKMDKDGRLLSFKYRMAQGNSNHDIMGDFDYENRIITINHRRNGNQRIEKLNLIKSALTEYQALAMLKKRGWVEGDSLSYPNLMTEKGTYIKVHMKLEKIERKIFANKSKNLYKVVRTIENIPGIQSITWVDSELLPYKAELIFPNMKYTLELTYKDNALQIAKGTPAAINIAKLKLKGAYSRRIGKYRKRIKKTELLVILKNGEPFAHELDGGLQRIADGNLKDGLKLTIDVSIPDKIKASQIVSHPDELKPFLRPNNYVESSNEKLFHLSKRLLVKESAWETSLKIKDWVYNNIMMTFKTGFDSALQTLEAGEGDCTEHAVLTAALCRANGIPARVAFGYTLALDTEGSLSYNGHMWTEVFIEGIWLPIDSTSPGIIPDPFRIRIFSSSLESRDIMKTTALFPLTHNLEITLISTFPPIIKED